MDIPRLTSKVAFLFAVIALHSAACLSVKKIPNSSGSFYATSSQPGTPQKFRVQQKTAVTALLVWEAPERATEGVRYEIKSDRVTQPVDDKQLSYLFIGLEPWTNHTFTLRAYVEKDGAKLYSEEATADMTTDMSEPSAPKFVSWSTPNSSALTLKWDKPVEPNGNLEGYIVTWKGKEEETVSTEFTIADLEVYTSYSISVAAFNIEEGKRLVGLSLNVSQRTEPGVPGPVSNFQVTSVSHTSVNVSWEQPLQPNGPVSGYYVTHTNGTTSATDKLTDETQLTLEHLRSGTEYRISVVAFNFGKEIYAGEQPVGSSARTKFDVVQNLSAISTKSSISVEWSVPPTTNVAVDGYALDLGGENSTTNETSYVWYNLRSWRDYSLTVTAFSKDPQSGLPQYGLRYFQALKTLASAPPVVGNITLSQKARTSIEFRTSKKIFSDENGPLREYLLLVAESEGMSTTAETGNQLSNETEFCNWESSKTCKTMYRASPNGWIPDKENALCKAEEKHLVCTVGKDVNCGGGFCNAQLKKATTYRLKIRGYTDGGYSESNVLEIQTSGSKVSIPAYGLILTLFTCWSTKTMGVFKLL